MSDPELSVVVASQDAAATIARCLRAVREDADRAGVPLELVVADASRDDSRARASEASPEARILTAPPGTLVPILWSRGIAAARGRFVAVTTAHCVPRPGWVPGLLAPLRAGYGGVGGAIDCAPDASLVDRAIYFTRYSAYQPPFVAHDADDLPGDNAAYDAATLRRFPAYVEDAFWEPFLHGDMRRDGIRLRLDPGPTVEYVHSYGALRFIAQRIRHGWHFGARRSDGEPAARSVLRGLALPVVPFMLFARVLRRVRTRPEARRRFLAAAPLVALFFAAFALGECSAALAAPVRGKR